MRWPGHIQPGGRTSALTQLFDIYPTIVQAIGGKLPPGHFAVSQLPVATGEVDSMRDAVFSEIGTTSRLRFMVRTPRWAWWAHGNKEALYDMKTGFIRCFAKTWASTEKESGSRQSSVGRMAANCLFPISFFASL